MSAKQSPTPHIIFIVTKLELGGAQKVCLELFNAQEQERHGATLISGTQGPLVAQVDKKASVHLLASMQREVGLKSLWNEYKAFRELVILLRTKKARYGNIVVHTHSTKAGLMGRWAAWWVGVPVVHTLHGHGFNDHQSWLRWLIIYSLEAVTALITNHFVCVSSQDQLTGAKRLPSFESKQSLIRAAVPAASFQAARNLRTTLAFNNQKIIIGSVSCFKKQKNLGDLIKAFSALYHRATPAMQQKLQLHIIGDGVLRSDLEQLISHHHLEHAVVLLGWQKDIAYWMAQWHLYAMSSLWEGLPCSIVEARLAGLPVVAYDVGGIREVVVDGCNGYLIPPGQWELLSYTMEAVAGNHKLWQAMHHYQDNLEPFLVPTMVAQHRQVYREIDSLR